MDVNKDKTFSPKHEAEADEHGRIEFPACDLKTVTIPPESSEKVTEAIISREEIADYGDQAFLLHKVITKEECQHFIDEGEKIVFEKIHGAKENYRGQQRYVELY